MDEFAKNFIFGVFITIVVLAGSLLFIWYVAQVLFPMLEKTNRKNAFLKSTCCTCKHFEYMNDEELCCELYRKVNPSTLICCSHYEPCSKNIPKELMKHG